MSIRPAQALRNDYSSTNVTTSAYVELTSATTRHSTGFEVFDSSGKVLKLAVGASGSEVDIPYNIPIGGTDAVVEYFIPSGSRVSIKAVDASAVTGQVLVNLYG